MKTPTPIERLCECLYKNFLTPSEKSEIKKALANHLASGSQQSLDLILEHAIRVIDYANQTNGKIRIYQSPVYTLKDEFSD